MAGAGNFVKVPSLRVGEGDCWCHKSGTFDFDGSHGNEVFFFHIKRTNADGSKIQVRRRAYTSPAIKCSVSAKLRESGEILRLNGVHNHLPYDMGFGAEYREAKRDWLHDIRDDPRQRPADVVLKRRRQLPVE